MLRAHIKLALRSLFKSRLFSIIKLFSLTTSLTACVLIGLYVHHELSYDAFHEKADRIARVTMEYHVNGETVQAAVTGTRVAPAFQRDFPEVDRAVRVYSRERVVRYDGRTPREEVNFYYADSTFFEVFTFPLISGDPRKVLDDLNAVVLTSSKAREYFGDEDPIGKVLRVEDQSDYTVTGVMKEPPVQSQLKPDFIASFHSLAIARPERETWWSANYATYLLLNQPADFERLTTRIPEYMRRQSGETGLTGDDYLTFRLEPLLDVHLRSDVPGVFEPNGDIRYVYVLVMVGALILVIGSSIYVNLSIATSMKRARQIGVQKVLGATPGLLLRQHLTEAVLVSGAAFLISVPMAAVLLPVLDDLFGRSLSAAVLFEPFFIGALVSFGAVVALLAGWYPAVVLSRLKPLSVLKGDSALSGSGHWLRKSLTVLQFFISVGLIICTLVLQRQIEYIQNKNLGYDKEHIVVLRLDGRTMDRIDVLRSEFLRSPQVSSVTVAYETPTFIQGGYSISSSAGAETRSPVTALPADQHFMKTFDLELAAGRGLSDADVRLAERIEDGSDSTLALPLVINESQARALGGSPDGVLGRRVEFMGPAVIAGVVKDFHFASLHEPIGRLVLFPSRTGNSLMVKLDGTNLEATLEFLRDRWSEVVSHRPFSYHFLDEEFDQLYGEEIRSVRLARAFSSIAIVLACLGLFGLATFSMVQRTKEIGIRKVLGATIPEIVLVLSSGFLKLVLIAFLAAMPVAYIVMQKWLDNFAYRTELSWWIFAAAGVGSVLIAALSMSYQVLRSATANPVRSLRYE